MLEKITKIKNLRNYQDFETDATFSNRKQVIYAPNGSGKTNMTRLFTYITDADKDLATLTSKEAQKLGEEISFSFELDGQVINEHSYQSQNELLKTVYVFNQDFIDTNISCGDFSDKDVSGNISIPLGEESKTIDKLEIEISDLRQKIADLVEHINVEFYKVNNDLSSSYGNRHKNIWKNFQLEEIIDKETLEIRARKEKVEFEDCEENLKIIDEKERLEPIKDALPFISLDSYALSSIKTCIEESFLFPSIGEKFENYINSIINTWIGAEHFEEGVKRSLDSNTCLLCQRKLDKNSKHLMQTTIDYFKKEEGSFKKSVTGHINNLEGKIQILRSINNNPENEVNKRVRVYGMGAQWTKFGDIETLVESLTSLIKVLENKLKRPETSFTDFDFNTLSNSISDLSGTVTKNKDLLKSINNKLDGDSKRAAELRTLVAEKYLYQFYADNKVSFDEIEDHKSVLKRLEEDLTREQKLLPSTLVLDNICKVFNHLLHNYIGINKYVAEKRDEKICLHLLDENISEETDLLSDGEKHMIGLCYYFASAIKTFDNTDKFTKAKFIIDDPVTSVSYSYFFGICQILQYFNEYIGVEILGESSTDRLHQVQKIILTHNTQLFNMLNTHVFKRHADYFFLNVRTLQPIGHRNLMSEMKICLYRIYEYSKDPQNNFAPVNELRRFFETLKYFYGITEKDDSFNQDNFKDVFSNFEQKINNLNKEEQNIFYNTLQYYSHGNPEALVEQLDPNGVSSFVFKFIEIIEESQFKGLWAEVCKLYDEETT